MQQKDNGTNFLIRFIVDSKDPNALLLICTDEHVANKVARKARHKLFVLWCEKTESIKRALKRKAAKEANRPAKEAAELKRLAEIESMKQAAMRAAKIEREEIAKGTRVVPQWYAGLSL